MSGSLLIRGGPPIFGCRNAGTRLSAKLDSYTVAIHIIGTRSGAIGDAIA